MKGLKKFFMFGLIFSFVFEFYLYADWRNYVWTYEYKVMKEEWLEIEHYATFSSPVLNEMRGNISVEHQIEIETGIAKNTDIGIYQVFNQNPSGELEYKGYKLRLRHKIGEKDEYFVDMLGYLEYIGVRDLSVHKIEFKKIFAKDFENFNVSFNTGFEIEKEEKFEYEYEYALGVSYGLNQTFRIGAEMKGSLKEHYAGPVISIKLQKIFFTLGSAIKLSEIEEGKPLFQIRLISGIGL